MMGKLPVKREEVDEGGVPDRGLQHTFEILQ
jgi:hypothetical protein